MWIFAEFSERNKEPAIVPSGWMSVSYTGKWSNASYCWKEESEIVFEEAVIMYAGFSRAQHVWRIPNLKNKMADNYS